MIAAPALAAAGGAAAAPAGPFTDQEIDAVFRRYAAFGDKAAGGAGDQACLEWLESELTSAGYACERQVYDVPAFEARETSLMVGAVKPAVVPLAIVATTPPGGLQAPLALVGGDRSLAGAIAVIDLPFKRWSAARDREISGPVASAFEAGAQAVVLVTNGPTRQAIALNAPVDRPLFDRPVAVLAPKDARPVLDAARAGTTGTLRVEGRSYRRPAANLIARLPSRGRPMLVLSTPRSGWFSCLGERGPGLAVWLALARWAARTPLKADVELLCTSGHEYDNAGGVAYLEKLAPPPARTALWLHLGANVAARDWHDLGELLPLPSADPQRYLVSTPELAPELRIAFRGQPGLEAAYAGDASTAAGELGHVLKAGYRPAAGIFGGHRFHHTEGDDLRCVSPPLAREVAEAFAGVIRARLA